MRTLTSTTPSGWLLAGLLIAAAPAWAGPPKPKPAAKVVIDNCINPADKVSFRAGQSGALLDADDGADAAAAIVARYPLIEHQGLYPKAVALWRKPNGDWLYATLMEKAKAPHAPCFSANVVAAGLKPTPMLLKKYFGSGQPPI